jgi:formylglycine-generating enzyme required for sulfatase activity
MFKFIFIIFAFMAMAIATPAGAAAGNVDATSLKSGSTFRDCPQCPQMTVVPVGQFLMGSSDEDIQRETKELPEEFKTRFLGVLPNAMDMMKEEQPQHSVTFDRPYAIGTYPVTRREFAAFVNETQYHPVQGCILHIAHAYRNTPSANWQNPGFTQSDNDPVTCVSWYDAQAYTDWLNTKITPGNSTGVSQEGKMTYQLPSEAEWEYAARAGTRTARWWGDDIGNNNAICNSCGSAWDKRGTGPVGNFHPNPYELQDMLGGLFQWTGDCWNNSYKGAPADGGAWTSGTCDKRVTRGGSWDSDAWVVRSASRTRGTVNDGHNETGFRVVKITL